MAKTQKPQKDRGRLATPTDLGANATGDIAGALNSVLADVFALYMKPKNFHWHVSGPNFRDYHLMFDEQAAELFAMTDPIAERVRKIGGRRSARSATSPACRRVADNEADYVDAADDAWPNCARTTRRSSRRLRDAHDVCDEHRRSSARRA